MTKQNTQESTIQEYQESYLQEITAVDPKTSSFTEYYESEGVRLPIYVTVPNKAKFPGKRPAVLFFYGGAFRIGSPLIFKEAEEILADQGYIAMSADYRIAAYHDVTTTDSIRDGAKAWKYVWGHSAEWGTDMEKMVICGGSAGGIIASMCQPLTGIRPHSCFLLYPGVLDENGGPSRLAGRIGTKEVDGVPVTSVNTLTPDTAPFHVIHGENDASIPVETIVHYVENAKKLGIDATLSIYPNTGHGFFNYNRDRAHFFRIVFNARAIT